MGNVAKISVLVFSLTLFTHESFSQLIWSETFLYATSGALTDATSNWLEYNTGTVKTQLASGSLTYTDYPESGSGNHIALAGGGQGVVRGLGSGYSGKVYLSFLIDLSAAPTTGVAFAHFDEDPIDGNSFNADLHVRDDGTGDAQFAIRKTFNSVLSNYSSSTAMGTILLVVSYEVVAGGSNDTVRVWVNPNLPGAEPPPTIQSDDPLATDPANIGSVVFVASSGVSATIAGIRVATSWDEAPLPVQLANFAATSSRSGVELRWSTATELNNYGFEIERRSVGAEEQEGWARVGFVQGAGTTTDPREYSFVDSDLWPGRYAYRIKQIDFSGAYTYYSAAEVEVGLAPQELALEPNYPNPFNPTTNISFTVPDDGRAILRVYNILGQEVAILFKGEAVAGRLYRATFDASTLPTGVYVSRLEFGGQSVMRKMLFVK